MGIIIATDKDNYYLNTFFDIVIVFVLGLVLLFFANAIKTENRNVMFYLSVLVSGILLYNMIFLHKNVEEKKKETNYYNLLTFMNIYMMILMVLLSAMSYYIISSVEDVKRF